MNEQEKRDPKVVQQEIDETCARLRALFNEAGIDGVSFPGDYAVHLLDERNLDMEAFDS
jgi:hypothetical protein